MARAALRGQGHTGVLRSGKGAKARAAAMARLAPQPGDPPLRVVATSPYIGEASTASR